MKNLVCLLLCLLFMMSGCSLYRTKNVAVIEQVSNVREVEKNQYFMTAKFAGGSANSEQRIALVKKKLAEYYTFDSLRNIVVEEYGGAVFNEFNYVITME